MAGQIKARYCYPTQALSSRVWAIYETCDGQLAIQFKRGVKFKGKTGKERSASRKAWNKAHGPQGMANLGLPDKTCLYPNVPGDGFFVLMKNYWSKGKFVHYILPEHEAYKVVAPPTWPCSGCTVTCSVASSKNPADPGDNVTFTATFTDADGTLPTQGTVEFFDGTTDLGAGTALSPSGNQATSTFTTSTLTTGTHSIKAVLTGTSGFQSCTTPVLTQKINKTVNCGGCTTVPYAWTLTVSGITNGTCTDSTNVNGTFTLNDVTSSEAGTWCVVWSNATQTTGTFCGATGGRYRMGFNTNTSVWQLDFMQDGELIYTIASGSLTCLGNNTWTGTPNDLDYTNEPTSITLSPA
jgi:hypothetical protein